MSMETALAELSGVLSDPVGERDGSALSQLLLGRARNLKGSDPRGLDEALERWLDSRDYVLTTHAVILIRLLRLTDLEGALRKVRNEVADGRLFDTRDLRLFDEALVDLGVTRRG